MARQPHHDPPEWELYRGESEVNKNRREAIEQMRAKIDAGRAQTNGMWWSDQRYVDQVVPAEMANPSTFDFFNYRYQVYARQPVQLPPRSLAEVTDDAPPIKYNVKRVAIDKPCASEPWACGAHWNKPHWVLDGTEAGQNGAVNCAENNNRAIGSQRGPGPTAAVSEDCCASISSASCLTSTSGQDRQNINNCNVNGWPHTDGATKLDKSIINKPWEKKVSCFLSVQPWQQISPKIASTNGLDERRKSSQDQPTDGSDGEFHLSGVPVWDQDVFDDVFVCSVKASHWLGRPEQRDRSQSSSYPKSDLSVDLSCSADHVFPLLDRALASTLMKVNTNNNSASPHIADKSKKNRVKPREYTLKGFAIQDCNDQVKQSNKLLCWPDTNSLDIPRDRVLIGKRVRQRIENEPYDEEKDGPLLCRPISSCPGIGACGPTRNDMFVCEPPPKDPKPKPGYGTYKIIGSRQYHQPNDLCPADKIRGKLPPDLEEYREFTRRCPNYKLGRYDSSDPANELILPSNISSTLLTSTRSPFTFLKPPIRNKPLPPLFKPEPGVDRSNHWRLPSFIVQEMENANRKT